MTIKSRINNKNGLTLIEVLITTVILSIVVFTVGYTFIVGLRLWDLGYTRANMRGKMTQAIELVSKNLRQASSIDEIIPGSITFTADLGSGSTSYRVYLYHEDDPAAETPYTESGGYQLRWAAGTTTYGSGAIIATDIKRPNPPSSNPFSDDADGNLITMNFTVEKGGQTFDLITKVRVRNL